MHGYWRRNGPPLNIMVQAIGRSLGVEWKAGPDKPNAKAAEGPSITELAGAMLPL